MTIAVEHSDSDVSNTAGDIVTLIDMRREDVVLMPTIEIAVVSLVDQVFL